MTSQEREDVVYDLVIVGAGCVGVAATYYAIKGQKTPLKICLVDKKKIGKNCYWTSRSGARQNRVQYSDEYLTRFAIESNRQWENLENSFKAQFPDRKNQFKFKEGSLWLGKKDISNSEGNIKAANANITLINSSNENKVRVQQLFMEKIMQGHPKQMEVFKPTDNNGQEWDSWSALYQPDGGSINMESSFDAFLDYVKSKKDVVDIQDQTTLLKHEVQNSIHIFSGSTKQQDVKIKGKKVLITMGVWTPSFLKQVMDSPDLKDNEQTEYSIKEYVSSYFKLKHSQEGKNNLYTNLPSFYNFLNRIATLDDKETQASGYGFGYHQWDDPYKTIESKQKYIHIGTSSNKKLSQEELDNSKMREITSNDPRIKAAIKFVKNRMNGLQPSDDPKKHRAFPIIYYTGRQTILDYLYRNRKTIVVQSGGWVDHLYPLLAKTAVSLLLNSQQAVKFTDNNPSIIENFISRTRFPITSRVKRLLFQNKSVNKMSFETVIVGAGCSGLYSAYRLNKDRKSKENTIAVFDLGHRISGRLKSFKFEGTATTLELGGMRYIPTTHILLNTMIKQLGIPSIDFKMDGDPIQNNSRKAYLRNDYYAMNQWNTTQGFKSNLHTSYNIEGSIIGMNAFQMISFSAYMVFTAPQNLSVVNEIFLSKTDEEIEQQKAKLRLLGSIPHIQKSWYRNWKNYIYQEPQNAKSYRVNLELKQWNYLKPVMLFRSRKVSDTDVYNGQQFLTIGSLFPLYKFGFQNVFEAQFGHEAYSFVSDEGGYYSNTSNVSYMEAITTYLLDFGNVTYRTLASGFDQINYAMANVLLDEQLGLNRKGEGIFLNHKLVDITSYQGEYILTFHVNNSIEQQDIKNFYKCNLNKQCKQHCQSKDILNNLGVQTKIPNSKITQIMVKAKNIILAMPRKSVTNLTSDIEILRDSIDSYMPIYNAQKQKYYQAFAFEELNKYLKQASTRNDPTQAELQQLEKLQDLQQAYIKDPSHNKDLTPQQKIRLQSLSYLVFIKSLKQLTPKDQELNSKKEKLFEDDLPIEPKTLENLAFTTLLMPAMRILMNFNKSWWDPNFSLNEKYKETFKNTNLINSSLQMRGVAVTDLPVRQTLYFSSGEDNLLLGSYNDMITTEYWTVLHNNFNKVWQPKDKLLNNPSVIKYDPNMEIHPAKVIFVQEILKQLSLTHQVEVKQEYLKECVYQFWGNDPFGAGYHKFFSGYHIPAVMKSIRQPWIKRNIHIVGQAFSNETGWVQGAFQTSELLMQQVFNLPQFVKGYYAGF